MRIKRNTQTYVRTHAQQQIITEIMDCSPTFCSRTAQPASHAFSSRAGTPYNADKWSMLELHREQRGMWIVHPIRSGYNHDMPHLTIGSFQKSFQFCRYTAHLFRVVGDFFGQGDKPIGDCSFFGFGHATVNNFDALVNLGDHSSFRIISFVFFNRPAIQNRSVQFLGFSLDLNGILKGLRHQPSYFTE